jgi:hypothetical protein
MVEEEEREGEALSGREGNDRIWPGLALLGSGQVQSLASV